MTSRPARDSLAHGGVTSRVPPPQQFGSGERSGGIGEVRNKVCGSHKLAGLYGLFQYRDHWRPVRCHSVLEFVLIAYTLFLHDFATYY